MFCRNPTSFNDGNLQPAEIKQLKAKTCDKQMAIIAAYW